MRLHGTRRFRSRRAVRGSSTRLSARAVIDSDGEVSEAQRVRSRHFCCCPIACGPHARPVQGASARACRRTSRCARRERYQVRAPEGCSLARGSVHQRKTVRMAAADPSTTGRSPRVESRKRERPPAGGAESSCCEEARRTGESSSAHPPRRCAGAGSVIAVQPRLSVADQDTDAGSRDRRRDQSMVQRRRALTGAGER